MASRFASVVVLLGAFGCPTRDHSVDPSEEEVEPVESVDIEYADAPFSADLDGNGELERIEWDCNDPAILTVGGARVELALGQSEVVDCGAAIVELPLRVLLYTSWDHEEAGLPTHVLYRFEAGELDELWSGVGELMWLPDGIWLTTRSTCSDRSIAIEVTSHRWADGRVVRETAIAHTPNEYGCADP